MDAEMKDPEIEKLLSKVRLKEVPGRRMEGFLAGVHERIDRGVGKPGFGFPEAALVLAIGLAFAGGIYFLVLRAPAKPATQPVVVSMPAPVLPVARPPKDGSAIFSAKGRIRHYAGGVADNDRGGEALSLEEESAIIEAFDEGSEEDLIEVLDDQGLLDEIDFLDTIEFSAKAFPS